ncbi:MAG: DUF1232 domain-containing protein [Dokdonella sp.]|nr:MAG: DUF1232 domain-containing protein [Dokdonella sp.]
MSLDLTIQLDDEDLEHFVQAMQRAQSKASGLSAEAVVAAASKLLVNVPTVKIPNFVKDRLEKLDSMIQLVVDEGYALPDEDRARVLSCLAYFADPHDIIPDSVPVIGFLDDAIIDRTVRPRVETGDRCLQRFHPLPPAGSGAPRRGCGQPQDPSRGLAGNPSPGSA